MGQVVYRYESATSSETKDMVAKAQGKCGTNEDQINQRVNQWIGLRENLQENPLFSMGKSMVSCKISLKPIQSVKKREQRSRHNKRKRQGHESKVREIGPGRIRTFKDLCSKTLEDFKDNAASIGQQVLASLGKKSAMFICD